MNIRLATQSDIKSIHILANKIWPAAYQNVLSREQIVFMLKDMYSQESLKAQFELGHVFLIAEEGKMPVGFASYSLYNKPQSIFKIHKLYILPQAQGKGVGKLLIDEIKAQSKAAGGKFLDLNVNRQNPSFNFYTKRGFRIFEEVNIPYHQYILNDYVMRAEL